MSGFQAVEYLADKARTCVKFRSGQPPGDATFMKSLRGGLQNEHHERRDYSKGWHKCMYK